MRAFTLPLLLLLPWAGQAQTSDPIQEFMRLKDQAVQQAAKASAAQAALLKETGEEVLPGMKEAEAALRGAETEIKAAEAQLKAAGTEFERARALTDGLTKDDRRAALLKAALGEMKLDTMEQNPMGVSAGDLDKALLQAIPAGELEKALGGAALPEDGGGLKAGESTGRVMGGGERVGGDGQRVNSGSGRVTGGR